MTPYVVQYPMTWKEFFRMEKDAKAKVAQWEVPRAEEVGLSSLAQHLRGAGVRVTLILELELPNQEFGPGADRYKPKPQR